MGLLPTDKNFKANAEIAAKIEAKSNPAAELLNQHNEGQPIRKNIDERTGQQRSKFMTDCAKQHRESLACIEDNYETRDVCQPFFEAYKTCRKKEHQRKLEENARLSGAGSGGDSCVIS